RRDDALSAGRRESDRHRRLHGRGGGIRAAVPYAGFLSDLRPVSVARGWKGLENLRRPQNRALCLFLCTLADHPVCLESTRHGVGGWHRSDGVAVRVGPVLGAVRNFVVYLDAARVRTGRPADPAGEPAGGSGGGGGPADRAD